MTQELWEYLAHTAKQLRGDMVRMVHLADDGHLIYLFSAPYKTGFAENGIFGLLTAISCLNSGGFHLTFGELNRVSIKTCGNLVQNVKTGSKSRSLNPKIGVEENR